MYTKKEINVMRKKLIEECEKSKGKKDTAINCSACDKKFAKICSSISGHPPKFMSDGKIVELWELSDLSKNFPFESLVAEAGKSSTGSSVQTTNQ